LDIGGGLALLLLLAGGGALLLAHRHRVATLGLVGAFTWVGIDPTIKPRSDDGSGGRR